MMKLAFAAGACLALCACGTQMGDRMASGAAIGAGTGAIAGGVGAIPGAIVGAGVGAFTTPEQVNLGEPVWDNETGDKYNEDGDPK
jgi:branched-subunit amino acid ABC-type transport system permease component